MDSDKKLVRTRIAPSPTGYPHIATIYQAMFDYILAKKYDGQFIVRIEDTDRARFVEGAEEVIFSSLDWFGLTPDEDPIKGGLYAPYRQSERLEIYKKHVDILLEKKHAYRCFCSKERLADLRTLQEKEKKPSIYDRFCLNLSSDEIDQKIKDNIPFVVRMKVPTDEIIKVHDSLVGDVEFDSNLIDDQVILKSDGFPTYHLAAVVDDYLMKISHIIRGKEWLPSTPKHVLLYKYFNWEDSIPKFTHLPLILNADGPGKLSKRQGHASVDYYKTEGILPEALLNYLSNIVWNHPEGKEIYPVKELEKAIDIDSEKIINVTSPGPRFDLKKLEWLNGEYIRAMSDEELTGRIHDYLVNLEKGENEYTKKEKIAPLVPLVKERIKKLSDFVPMTAFLFEGSEYDRAVFDKLKINNLPEILEKIIQKLEALSRPWSQEEFAETFRKLAEEEGISNSQIFQLIRIAFSGQSVTPPLLECMLYLGEDAAIQRIKEAKEFLQKS